MWKHFKHDVFVILLSVILEKHELVYKHWLNAKNKDGIFCPVVCCKLWSSQISAAGYCGFLSKALILIRLCQILSNRNY